jgi:hypothetical protein
VRAGLACAALAVWANATLAQAPDTIRIATYNPDLARKGPGLLLRDILSGTDAQVEAVIETLAALNADTIALTDFDFDYDLVALSALAERLAAAGPPYPFRFAKRPNSGLPTGLDMDGDGRLGGPRDAQGFGYFSGQGGLAVLSRLPLDEAAFRDFSAFLWQDLPGNLIGDSLSAAALSIQRLSYTAHWDLPIVLPNGGRLHLLIWHATPPVFDGPEDRNGRRNHDEAAFWLAMLDSRLPLPAPDAPFILLGDANLDPEDGDGRNAAMNALLAHPRIQDIAPKGSHNRNDPTQSGDPLLDTALYDFGGLRVDFVLPSSDLRVTASGVVWPDVSAPNAATLATASRHRPVWVDIALPKQP